MRVIQLVVTFLPIFGLSMSMTVAAADAPAQSPYEESKRLLLTTTWEAHIWGPYGKGYYPSVKCQEKATDILCSYSGGARDQDIKYEVLPSGELNTLTTRGVPVTLVRKGDGFESLARDAGIKLTPKK